MNSPATVTTAITTAITTALATTITAATLPAAASATLEWLGNSGSGAEEEKECCKLHIEEKDLRAVLFLESVFFFLVNG